MLILSVYLKTINYTTCYFERYLVEDIYIQTTDHTHDMMVYFWTIVLCSLCYIDQMPNNLLTGQEEKLLYWSVWIFVYFGIVYLANKTKKKRLYE